VRSQDACSYSINDDLDQRSSCQCVELRRRQVAEAIGPDDVDHMPAGKGAELSAQQFLTFSINGEGIEDRFRERSLIDRVGRGRVECSDRFRWSRYGEARPQGALQRALEVDRCQPCRPVHRIDSVRLRRLAARPDTGSSASRCEFDPALPQAVGRRCAAGVCSVSDAVGNDRFGELYEHFSQARPPLLRQPKDSASRAS